MGQKAGKHSIDADGEGSTSPKRSPKRSSKRGSKVSKSSSRESTPNPDIPKFEEEPHRTRQDIQQDLEKENPKKSPTKSPPRSPPKKAKSDPKVSKFLGKSKSPKKSAAKEVVEEPMTVDQHRIVESQNQSTPSQQSPIKIERQEIEPLTPLNINMSVANHSPQATSTPAANGIVVTGVQPSSPPLSPGSTDQSDDEATSPAEQQSSVRSPSPTCSFASISTTGSIHRRQMRNGELASRQVEPNFGRFYTTSYLDGAKSNYLRRSTNSMEKERAKSPHFHRPVNFTYSKDPPDFLKKKGSGMSALATGKRVVKVRRSSSPADLKNEEAIRLSMFPSAKPKEPNEPDKIERDDWPGPASPAAILPEILRERRRSRGETNDDEEEEVQEDPRIQREIDEISKIKDESGIGKVIFQELAELKQRPPKPMDPWKASRVPSAKYEPRYHTRYQSPMFASPSRFLDLTRRSWDDHDIRGYRSAATLANLPTPKPGYGPAYSAPRAATLPVTGMYGGRDLTYFGFRDESQESEGHQRSNYTSTSTLTGDNMSRGRSGVSSAVYDVPSIPLLKLQKSTWHTESDPPIYEYEKLKITKFDLPRDVDRNKLEIHLNDEEFTNLFKMPRDRFYRLAEWKRNDMKKKLDLY